MKRSRLNPVSKTRRKRGGKPGHLGIVRVFGKAMEDLRWTAFLRSRGRCEMVRFGEPCRYPITFESMELAHIKNKRMYGDTLDNVLCSCSKRDDGFPGCHQLSHNANGKPCPPKPN